MRCSYEQKGTTENCGFETGTKEVLIHLPLLIILATLLHGWHLGDFQLSNTVFLHLFRCACQICKLERNGSAGSRQKEKAVSP